MLGFGQVPVTIPDANFKAYLVGNTAINTNGDNQIQVTEAAAFNGGIYCQSMSISNLTGIEAFTALTWLDCGNNQLSSLDVSQNTALIYLRCYNNSLSSLNVSNNTALIDLRCYNNSLSSLNLSNNTALETLRVMGNNLTSLDVSNNISLTYLSIGSFTGYPGTPSGSVPNGNSISILDVSTNTVLTTLNCGRNQFDSLDVSNNILLSWLTCRDNNLNYLNTSGAVNLFSLRVWNNQLTTLDLSTNDLLTNIYCQNNQLTSLDVSNCTSLVELECSYNNLTSLDIRNNNNQNMTGSNGPGPYGCCYGNDFSNNPFLFCINVSDSTWAANNWTVANNAIDAQHYFSNNCSGTTEIQEQTTNKELLKVTDLLGRETKATNQLLFYIYNDGTVEKKVVIE
jgi:Leucine-rich repeat (LRR) protein